AECNVRELMGRPSLPPLSILPVVILIVGGMGFIGMNTALRLVEVGEKVVITQHSTRRVPEELEKKVGGQVFTARMDVANGYEVFDDVRRPSTDLATTA